MPESGSPEEMPTIDDPFERDEDAEKRVYGTVLGTREPTAARAIAGRADCDPKTARKYLDWFARLGIVREHDGQPRTYERNDAFFEWRYSNELAESHTTEELGERVVELSERAETYRERYDAESPSEVDALAATSGDVEAVWAELTDWSSVLQELRRHDRARRLSSDSARPAKRERHRRRFTSAAH
jgi:hypothetical protein